jgi:cyanophycinase
MAGPIALVGSGEFLPSTEAVDHALVDFSGTPKVVILPTAAGREGRRSVKRWLDLGVAHYERLGASPVPLEVVDDVSADDPEHAAAIAGADLIYFSGGDPTHLTETMRGSAVWDAVARAWRQGAALAGCSAGAMMMGSITASPRRSDLQPGLGVFSGLCVLPHFDRLDQFRPGMAQAILAETPPGTTVIGVDEDTGLVFDGAAWSVQGRQQVWLIDEEGREGFGAGESVPLDLVATL